MNFYFASETTNQASGIGALGVNFQAFIFQLITFGLIVLFLNKFVVSKLFAAIDERRAEIDAGLERSQLAQQELEQAGVKVEELIKDARAQADELLHEAQEEAAKIVQAADDKASQKAERIVTEAREQLKVDIDKAKQDLRRENIRLIAKVSGEIIGEKLDSNADAKLIANALEKN